MSGDGRNALEPAEAGEAGVRPNADDWPSAKELLPIVGGLRLARQSRGGLWKEEAEAHERPSRQALLGIVEGLRAVLFPSHFGTLDPRAAAVDDYVQSTLASTLRSLEAEVRRTLAFEYGLRRPDDAEVVVEARTIVHAFAATLPSIRQALEEDIRAAFDGDPAARSRSEVILCYPGITAILHHRLAHELYRLRLHLLARVVSELAHSETGIDIHPGARIGARFFIDHGTGVVVGETAVIGDRVRLYQGVTLGARSFPVDADGSLVKGEARHPVLEDDVVVYAGATVLGRITIGRGSTIGGNVFLVDDVPPHSRVTQASSRHELYVSDTRRR